MTSNIKLKRSAIQGKVPTTEQLEYGELAINTADIALYTKDSTGNIIALNDWANLLNKPDLNSVASTASIFYGSTAPDINEYEFWYHTGNGLLYVVQPATSDNVAGWTVAYSGTRGTSDVPASGTVAVSDRLTADRTYYVSPHGNNRNDGLTPDTPFRTIAMALIAARKTDVAGYKLTIQLADGTYNEVVSLPVIVGATQSNFCFLQGNLSDPSKVLLKSNGTTVSLHGKSVWVVKSLSIEGSTSCVATSKGGMIRVDNVRFGACSQHHMIAYDIGHIQVISNCTVYASADYSFISSITNGVVLIDTGVTITFLNNPVYNTVMNVGTGGNLEAISVTFTGAVTGYRYGANMNACIYTNTNSNATYFPGSMNGLVFNGGQYF